MATGKLEDPRVLELARKSVIASMQRMVYPRTPFSTRIHSGFSARGIPVTSRFLDFVLDDLVSLNIVARSGGMHLSIMTADDLHVFLSAPGFVETISHRALMRFFARPVPSLEASGLTLRRSGEEGSYTYEIIYKAPESMNPVISEPEEPNLDWMSIPGFDAYIRKQQAALAGARVGSDQMTVTRYVDSDLTERIDLKIPILTVPDLGCFVNVSAKNGNITASWNAATYGRLPDNILTDHVKLHDRLVLRDVRGRIVKKAPTHEVLEIYLDGAHSEMKKRLTEEVVMAASVRLKELKVVTPEETQSEKTEEVPLQEEKPEWETRLVEDFPLPEVEDSTEEEEAPLTRQSWMDFVTDEQLKNLRQAQEVVVKLMDGHGLSRSEMFGKKDVTGWQAAFCRKLKDEGILNCVGTNKWARWSATPEGLERLSSIEQLIPFVFSTSEVARYQAFLQHGIDVPVSRKQVHEDLDEGDLGVDEEVSVLEAPSLNPIVPSVSTDLEARMEELEELVQQQNTMILNLTKQMTVMIGHWKDLKSKVDP